MIREIDYYLKTLGLAGLLCGIRAKLTQTTRVLKVARDDCRFPLFVRIPSSDVPTYRQVFIDHAYAMQLRTEPRVIVDAGANIGLASIYFANRYPQARIIAVEPENGNFAMLRRNTEAYANIVPVQAALWNTNKDIELVDRGLGSWGFMTQEPGGIGQLRGKLVHTVRAMTVDRLIEIYALDRIDVLKIDIEGAEREVFSDTAAWIDKVDVLVIELHERMKPGCNRSFYSGSNGFDAEWQRGENVFLARNRHLLHGDMSYNGCHANRQ